MVSLKQFVLSVAYKEFQDYLEEQIRLLHISMESTRNTEDLCRLQGQVFGLRKLQKLREELTKRDR